MDKHDKGPEVAVDEDEASVEGHADINNRPLDAGPGKTRYRKPLFREPRVM